jgi:hypothetical protein
MSNNYIKTQLDSYSLIKCDASINPSSDVLMLKFTGIYHPGSEGNGDGMFMLATTAAYCAIHEPASLIVDLLDLNYQWGNTILKTLNYFWEQGKDDSEKEKQIVIVAQGVTRNALQQVQANALCGKRIFTETLDQAKIQAEDAAKQYLE